jgi:predicted PurR-regulated permease PerM
MRSEPPAGVLTWLITVVTTCFLLFLFQKVLWLVVPVLLALVLYYCLRPLLQALVRAGLKHRAAAIALAGMLFLVTVLAMILFLPVVASHAAGWKETMMRYAKGGLNFVKKTKELLEQNLPVLKRSALFGGAPKDLNDWDAVTGQFAEKYLSSFLLQMVHWLLSLLLMPYLTYFLLQDGNRFKKHLIHSVPNAFFEKTLLLVDRIDNSLQNFFVGLMKLTFLDTVCLAFGLWVLGVSFPLLLGLICAVFA